jgi:hypothetical protein
VKPSGQQQNQAKQGYHNSQNEQQFAHLGHTLIVPISCR